MDTGARERRFTGEDERYRTLLEINNAIISRLTRDELFRAIAQAVGRVMPTVLIYGETGTGKELIARAVHSRSARRDRPLVKVNCSAISAGLVESERTFPAEDQALADGVRSYVIVPLAARGRTIGTFAVASMRTHEYDEADVTFLQEVANQVALAIENMVAYEEIAALKARLERENAYLQEEIQREHNFVEMVGSSPALTAVLAEVDKVAPTDATVLIYGETGTGKELIARATVLIYGETGTGKELIARAVHSRSARRDRPLVKVNCSAISAGLVESELFGHVKGAFTGALERRIGRFELADRGTIFLDEVGELAPETQVKLLRVLQEQEFEPVGSSTTRRVNVRVIAATNRRLSEAVAEGRFRADLFYRLNVFPLEVPPLRDRLADVPQLAAFFLARYAKKFGKRVETVSETSMRRLMEYGWPGNVRELQNVIERAVVLAAGPVLDVDPEPTASRPATPTPVAAPAVAVAPVKDGEGLPAMLEAVERAHIIAALEQSGGVVDGARGAARRLKMHPNTLRSRIEKLGIKRPGHEIS